MNPQHRERARIEIENIEEEADLIPVAALDKAKL